MPFSPSSDLVFADGPASNPQQPSKLDIRKIFKQIEQAVDAYSSGAGSIAKATKALLDADLSRPADTTAWVYADATAGNNGIYRKSGASGSGAWMRILDLPYSFIFGSNTGSGSSSAIRVSTSIPVTGSSLITFPVVATNQTSPVTVKFNDDIVLTVKTAAGNDIAVGGLGAGMIVTGFKSGDSFRLISDQASAAIVAAAEAAKNSAEAAAAAALGAVPTVFVTTRAALKGLNTNLITAANLKENGRGGQFLWRSGDYSAQIAADPLEGVFIKADGVAASVGAWVRQAGYLVNGVDAGWFGAMPQSDPLATTAAIQRAMNLTAFLGAGRTTIGGGQWHLSETQTETFLTTAMPDGMRNQYALLVPSGVMLEGQGYMTVLKRYVAKSLVVILCANTTGAKVTNLRVDGNQTQFPIAGDTYGSGAGIFLESGTGTEDRDCIIDTVWIRDTPGYGLAAEWGNHRGLVIRNVFINGTGSDGIDIKRMNSGAFEAYAIVLDTIIVEDFGRTATDAAQAGIDLRGYFTASNLHVRKFGDKARAGIRLRGGIAADTILGAMRSVISNFRVERVSGGEATTFGLEVNPDFVSADNGVVDGCTDNFRCVLAGAATAAAGIEISNCKSFNASRNGFRIDPQFRGVRLIACSDIQTAVTSGNAAFRIEGLDTKLVTPYIRALSGLPVGIQIVSGAQRTGVIQPTYEGSVTTPLSDAGAGTVIL